jgi:hypothetical protein
MSKNLKRTWKESKDGSLINIKESQEIMEKYRMKKKENIDFEIKYFGISITILLSTNVYIHKTVLYFLK